MEEYVDSISYHGTNNYYTDGTLPALTWQYAVTPAWIHDFLWLWERDQILSVYLEKAVDRIAQDIQSNSIRRQTLYQITYDFVPLSNRERRQRTISPNIWAAFSKLYDAESLAPAYLANIIAGNGVVSAVNGLLHRYSVAGDTVSLRDVRPYLVSRFGDRAPIRASAGSVLRTLVGFGVLTQPDRSGNYRINPQMNVEAHTLPLLVYAWWQLRRWPEVRLDDLADDALMAFIDIDSCADAWRHYDGALWTLKGRDGVMSVEFRATDDVSFLRLLLNTLASHPRWPAVSREMLQPASSAPRADSHAK